MYSSAKIFTILLSLFLLLILAGCNSGRVEVEPAGGTQTIGDLPTTGDTSSTGGTATETGNRILSWQTPTLYSDGTPVAPGDIKEYRVYFSTSSGSYSPENSYIVSAPTTSIRIKDIITTGTGTYYFAVTAVDLADIESDFSNEASTVLTDP